MRQDDGLFHYMEQHYLADQAEALLHQCLEQQSSAPLRGLIERLVLEGPHNLPALHLIWKIITQRRAQIEQDARTLWEDLQHVLRKQGLVPPADTPWEALYLDANAVQRWLTSFSALPLENLEASRQALHNALTVLQDMRAAWALLRELEEEVESWAWGLARLAALSSPPFEQVL